MASEIGKRVKYVRKELLQISSQQEFADKLGISRGYVGDIESGRKEPSFNFLKTLLDAINVNLNWLLTGEGRIYHTDGESNLDKNPEICKELREWWEGATEKERIWLEVEVGRLLRGK